MPREDGITRRDFLQGVLLAAGGVAVSQFVPIRALAHGPQGQNLCDGPIGTDPNVLFGGNLRGTFDVAHWLRDNRLTWMTNSVRISPNPCDNVAGTMALIDDTGQYDLIVVGGGISGLATAFFTRQLNPDARVLILEDNPRLGGNASRDDDGLPVHASAAGAYFAYPYTDFLFDFYGGVGIDWNARIIPGPIYSYYFDSSVGPATTTSLMPAGTRMWVSDAYTSQGIDQFPFPTAIRQQFHMARQDLRNWYVRSGAPTDPPDDSNPKYDNLAHKSFREYLTVDKGFNPVVADFYDQYSSDSLAGLTQDANAHSSISFLGAEYNFLVSAPGGLSYVARKALKTLIPASITGSSEDAIINNPINVGELDRATNLVRYRTGITALRCETGSSGAQVNYYNHTDGKFYRAQSKAVVLAGQMYTAHRLVEHLASQQQFDAANSYIHMPTPTANVAVNTSQFLVDAEVGYNFYWYGDPPRIWQDAVIADWTEVGGTPAAEDGSRPNALTFYSGGFVPYEQAFQERLALLNEPFSTYENELRQDLGRIFGDFGFDFDRDVTAIHLYRWGHAMVAPYVGWLFGQPIQGPGQQVTRTVSDRTVARQQLGRISFAAQDSEGNPAIENAIFSGRRAAQEADQFL